jgi:hypothetical protein
MDTTYRNVDRVSVQPNRLPVTAVVIGERLLHVRQSRVIVGGASAVR